jgi:hypothetical protein
MLAETGARPMQQSKALKFAIVVGTTAAALLMLSTIRFVAPQAQATPDIAKGKPCNTCHTSASPSKEDLKK